MTAEQRNAIEWAKFNAQRRHAASGFCRELVGLIEELTEGLEAAEHCIYEIEDALHRGNGNDWATAAIEEWEQRKGASG